MEPKSSRPNVKAKRVKAKSKISTYSLVGAATGLCYAFFLHNQLLTGTLLGKLSNYLIIAIINLPPVVATIASIVGLKDRVEYRDISRIIAVAGLVFGIGSLMVSIAFSYALLNDGLRALS